MADDLEERTVYVVTISGTYRVEADDSTDAINKAKEYVEANAGKLSYGWLTLTVNVKTED